MLNIKYNKQKARFIISLLMSLALLFTLNITTFANDNSVIINKLKNKVEKLNDKYKSDKSSIYVDESKLTSEYVEFINNMSDRELDLYLEKFYIDGKDIKIKTSKPKKVIADESRLSSNTNIDKATTLAAQNTYIGDVWAGIPSIGYTTVHIRYNCTIENGGFTSAEVTGSWMDGLSLVGTYTHLYGSCSGPYPVAVIDLYATATLTYGISGTPLSYTTTQTFLYKDYAWNH